MQNRPNSCGFILNQYHAELDQFVWNNTQSIPCIIRPICVDLYSINTMQNLPIRVDLYPIKTLHNRPNSCGFKLNQYDAESDQFVCIYTESIPCRIGPIRVDVYSINTMHNQTNSCGFILNQYHAESDQFVWIYNQ